MSVYREEIWLAVKEENRAAAEADMDALPTRPPSSREDDHDKNGDRMSDQASATEPDYHLFLDSEEVGAAGSALRLLISDEAHEPQIRGLAREVIANLDATPDEQGKLTVPLSAEQMKITHTAVKLLLDDLQRGQAEERAILRRILEKLPDEHTMRAIKLTDK